HRGFHSRLPRQRRADAGRAPAHAAAGPRQPSLVSQPAVRVGRGQRLRHDGFPLGERSDPLRGPRHRRARAGGPRRADRRGARRARGRHGRPTLAGTRGKRQIEPAAALTGGHRLREACMAVESGDRMRIVIYYAVWATICATAAGIVIALIHTWLFSYIPNRSGLIHTLFSDAVTALAIAAGQGAVVLVTGSVLAQLGRSLQGTVLLGLLIGRRDRHLHQVHGEVEQADEQAEEHRADG